MRIIKLTGSHSVIDYHAMPRTSIQLVAKAFQVATGRSKAIFDVRYRPFFRLMEILPARLHNVEKRKRMALEQHSLIN